MIELLVLQPTSFCNLDCSYCYVPDRANTGRMTRATLVRLVALLQAEPEYLGDELEVLWHAGEPLAAGLGFYEEASLLLGALATQTRVVQTFQTNGTMIDEAWCAFFQRVGAHVGISLDGPREIHDATRKTRRGSGSFAATMRGVERMQRAGLEVSALSVVTSSSLSRAQEILEFFLDAGITAVGFNVEEVEGENSRSSLLAEETSVEVRFRDFMREMIIGNLARGAALSIREVQSSVRSLADRRRSPSEAPRPAETEVGRILTIGRDGEVFSFSPELASGLPGKPEAFSIGNIHAAASLSEILNGSRAKVLQSEISAGLSRCAESCSYFGICGGGSPANKIYENGSFASTATIKCRLQVCVMADLLLDLAASRSS